MLRHSPMVVVVGPTGSGKSDLAVRLAWASTGEIINCDSLQIYRLLDIGTAKVPQDERRGVPHHLIDIADPDEHFTAGDYARRARTVLHEIVSRGRLPVVVGGTGFYLRALLEGLFPGPGRDDALRRRLAARESHRAGSLHRILSRLDPLSARRIHRSDAQKLVRAIEVCLLARKPLSELFSRGREPLQGFRVLKIGLDPSRPALYARLDARCLRMFQGGLIEEVAKILALGVPADAKPLESHGYRQAVQVLRGEITFDQAVLQAQRNTRRYAKRQWTWFRREPEVEWFRGFGDEESVQVAASNRVRDFCNPV